VFHGPIRALGLQKTAGLIAVLCNWPLGLPLAAIFAFKTNFGVFGLMAGFSSSSFCELISYLILLVRKNWHDVAAESASRIQKEEKILQKE